MINKTVSINIVIQEIVRDLGLGSTNVPFNDIKEWIIEGLKHIGVKAQFREEIRDIKIENYTGKLPCETYKVGALIDGAKYFKNINLTIDDDDKDKAKTIGELCVTRNDYNIQFQEITTSFKVGIMRFRLILLPLDKEGFLLIPDSISYKDALMWKIAYHLSIRGHKFPQQRMNDMEYNKQKWNYYCMQARGQARMPDAELMNILSNEFHRFIINPNEYQNGFSSLGRAENLDLGRSTI
jgi:hypothetical protein